MLFIYSYERKLDAEVNVICRNDSYCVLEYMQLSQMRRLSGGGGRGSVLLAGSLQKVQKPQGHRARLGLGTVLFLNFGTP